MRFTLLLVTSSLWLGSAAPDLLAQTPSTTPPSGDKAKSSGDSKPAATDASFDELMKKGEASVKSGSTAASAAESTAVTFFERAAKVAPNEDKKFQALVRAAEVSAQVKDHLSALEFYDAARNLTKVSAEKKAQAQFGYAANRHQYAKATNKPLSLVPSVQADYEAALKMTALPARLRIQGHEAVGDLLLIQGKRLQAIREYQKILALPGAKSPAAQTLYLNRIVAELPRLAASPEAAAVAATTYKQFLPLQKTPEAIAAAKKNFAMIYLKQNQVPRSLALWNEIADDKTLPLGDRVDALRKVGAAQRTSKNWAEALRAADRLTALPGITPQAAPALAAYRGWDRAGVFLAQGDEAKARTEWQAMIDSPQIITDEKGRAWMEMGASYERESKAKPGDAALLGLRKKAYDAAWKLEGANPAIRAQALLNLGQIEINAKNSPGAIAMLLDAVKQVETWKASPEAITDMKREFLFAVAKIYRGDKNYTQAIATLVQAQQFNKKNDKKLAQTAVAISQDAYAAKQWDVARGALLALKNTWGFSQKMYLLNLVEVDVAEQKWADAKKSLDEVVALKPTPQEQVTVDRLRAKLPAGT